MTKTAKYTAKRILIALLAAVVLALAAYSTARFGFGCDIFDRSGWAVGEDGGRRYLDYRGDALLGWQTVEGTDYYFDPLTGRMHTGWLKTEGETYYLSAGGVKTTGLVFLDGQRYFFDESGRMHTGWLQTGEDTFFFTDSGQMHTGWLDEGGQRYYFGAGGGMYVGWLDTPQGRFLLGEDGAMRTGWAETAEGLCYLSPSGAVSSGWVDTDRGRFYIDPEGTVRTGWLTEQGRSYYLTDSGMHTGWLELAGERYYFHEDGTMAVGRVEIDGKNRYFTATGKYFVLVNPWNYVPEDYELDLVDFDGYQVDASCYDALVQLRDACLAAGKAFNLTSAYRSHNYQTTLFQRKVDKLMAQGYTLASARAETARSIAIPGTSEHQLGLAVDIKSGQGTYDWLAQHSWEYGFIVRYPSGTTALTGIYYEPWHLRYVGTEFAREIYDSGLCVEAYMNMLTENAAA